MSNFKFEGELTGLSARQLEFVSSVLQEIGFNHGKILVSAVGKAGDGFGSTVKRFSVDEGGEKLKIVAKVASSVETVRDQMKINIIFKNESLMYTAVLPKFTELEKLAGVPENERLRYATCYGSLTEEPNEIILLEDLQEPIFIMMEKSVSLSNDCVKLFLKNLAVFHSLSYALKHQKPETFEAFKNKLVNVWEMMSEMEHMKIFFTQMESNVVSILDNDEYFKLVKRFLPHLHTNMSKNYMTKSLNILFCSKGMPGQIIFYLDRRWDDKPVECCMIDYQGSNHNTPVADLEYMIFNCTDYETRAKHYHDWIDYYHSELDRCLANFGLKANLIYPRDQLDADLRRYGKTAFAVSLMLTNVLLTQTDEAAKVKETLGSENGFDNLIELSKLSNMPNTTLKRIKVRIEGLIISFTEFGYL